MADTLQWEQSAAFHLEAAALRGLVKFYAKNDHVGLTIQYQYFGVPHNYEPDFLVRLKNGVSLLLEIKEQEDNRDRAKHDAAQRWVTAVNNWGKEGTWALHVCRNPNVLERELEYLLQRQAQPVIANKG